VILKALYDYYNRCEGLAPEGYEYKELGFLIRISIDGVFRQIEDCRIDKKHCKVFLVPQIVSRPGSKAGMSPCLMWDNVNFVLGVPRDETPNPKGQYLDAFRDNVAKLSERYPDSVRITAVNKFYLKNDDVLLCLREDPHFNDLISTNKWVSFRVEGDTKIVAEDEILRKELNRNPEVGNSGQICMVTGKRAEIVRIHHKTPLPGATFASLISFQKSSGFDSYGKKQAFNAPISVEAEFAYTTALNTLLGKQSRNKFSIGERIFLFWASNSKDSSRLVEESVFNMFGFADDNEDDPNARIEKVRQTFMSIYNGTLHTDNEDRFYILGLAPNSARIAVVYWSDTVLRDFACKILYHFDDMDIIDTRNHKIPYKGQKEILSAVTLGGKSGDATPNLPEAVVKSIFEGTPYPHTLLASCIRRIRAEQDVMPYNNPCRVAIIKAYLNRLNDNNKKIQVMLDKENKNEGYLCGRLFAVLDKIQEDTYHINSIRERYLNSASATPSAVFATILNLSSHHSEKLNDGAKVFYEKLKQEIIAGLPADGFPAHLDLQNQGRFFVGYYHQRQDFFAKKDVNVTE